MIKNFGLLKYHILIVVRASGGISFILENMPRFVFLVIFPVFVVTVHNHHEMNLHNSKEDKEEGHSCENNVAHFWAALIHGAISEWLEISSLLDILAGLVPGLFVIDFVEGYVDSEKILDSFTCDVSNGKEHSLLLSILDKLPKENRSTSEVQSEPYRIPFFNFLEEGEAHDDAQEKRASFDADTATAAVYHNFLKIKI